MAYHASIVSRDKSVLTLAESADRLDKTFLRHRFDQRGASGRFQAEDVLNIRSAEDFLKTACPKQFVNMGRGLRGKGAFNVRFFRRRKRSADMRTPRIYTPIITETPSIVTTIYHFSSRGYP